MKYTNKYIQKLDAQTIDFCCRWVWDALKRRRITENDGKTKAQREYAHDSNNGIEFAFDMLRKLKNYNNGSVEMAQEFTLLDDNIKE